MILSASRRTDIPAFFGNWFMNRINEGYVMVRNPVNFRQISIIPLNPDLADCIVFWTKNPEPFFPYLHKLDQYGYKYYFLFTVTPYGSDLESNLPDKEQIINTFKKLSEKLGAKRVVWRYDPILFTNKINEQYHYKNFTYLCKKLSGYTDTCIISFLEMYQKCRKNLRHIAIQQPKPEQKKEVIANLSKIAEVYQIQLQTCAVNVDISNLTVTTGKCIDDDRIASLLGYSILNVKKDKNQRGLCNCIESIDIGAYHTCMHNCLYCYANYNKETVKRYVAMHDPASPLLIGTVDSESKITERRIRTIKPRIQK